MVGVLYPIQSPNLEFALILNKAEILGRNENPYSKNIIGTNTCLYIQPFSSFNRILIKAP
jgi:hypothetical protein